MQKSYTPFIFSFLFICIFHTSTLHTQGAIEGIIESGWEIRFPSIPSLLPSPLPNPISDPISDPLLEEPLILPPNHPLRLSPISEEKQEAAEAEEGVDFTTLLAPELIVKILSWLSIEDLFKTTNVNTSLDALIYDHIKRSIFNMATGITPIDPQKLSKFGTLFRSSWREKIHPFSPEEHTLIIGQGAPLWMALKNENGATAYEVLTQRLQSEQRAILAFIEDPQTTQKRSSIYEICAALTGIIHQKITGNPAITASSFTPAMIELLYLQNTWKKGRGYRPTQKTHTSLTYIIQPDSARAILDQLSDEEKLIALTMVDSEGNTPLHHAVSRITIMDQAHIVSTIETLLQGLSAHAIKTCFSRPNKANQTPLDLIQAIQGELENPPERPIQV